MGLEAVEIVMAVEESFGIDVSDADAEEMQTPAHLIAHVQNSVKSSPEHRSCISQRAFHQVRVSLSEVTGASRSDIRLRTHIRKLFPKHERSELWNEFRMHISLSSLPDLRFGHGFIFSPTRVQDLVSIVVSQKADELRKQGDWTDEEVRQVVRMIISEQLWIKKFSDSDEFIRDLGVG